MYKNFWDLFTKEYGQFRIAVTICIVTAAASILEGINITLLVPLLETLNSTDEKPNHRVSQAVNSLFDYLNIPFELWTILLALGLMVLCTAGLKYLRLVIAIRARVDFVAWLRTTNMRNLLRSDMSYFQKERLGRLSDTLTVQSQRAGDSLHFATDIIAASGIVASYTIAAFLISPLLTLIVMVIILVVVGLVQSFISRAKRLGAEQVLRENELHDSALESLIGISVVKAFLLERRRTDEFENKAKETAEILYRASRNTSQLTVLQEIVLFALVGGIVYIGVSILGVSLTVVVALLFVMYRLMPRITSINTMRHSLTVTLASLASVQKTMEDTAEPTIVSGKQSFPGLKKEIELQNVEFSYHSNGKVLEGTSFSIEKGKMTAILGVSGSGKSTLIDLLLRNYDPTRGSLLVDGVDLRNLDLEEWRRYIGTVSQDTFLFNDTVSANISLGRPGATLEKIIDAAERAHADKFIQRLPDGYDTKIGDRGTNLSGGQRQRIAMARAVLNDPEILILDEATSSLDSRSERLIQESIRRLRDTCTIIVVAHRISTIQDADKIVILEDGRISEEGDWNSILAATGAGSDYLRSQLGDQ